MMGWWKKCILGILLGAFAWAAAAATPGFSQNIFELIVVPADFEVPLGMDLVLELAIEDGLDLNAFDVAVEYDAEVLSLLEWAHGDYFTNLANVSEVNQPGYLRVAATQLATDPVSGDGVLLELSFNAKAQGVSDMEITRAEFADSANNSPVPELVNGTISVVLAPTYTPTLTVTPTVTVSPTFANTTTSTATLKPSPTLTPTMTPFFTATRRLFATNTTTQRPSATSMAEEVLRTPPGTATAVENETPAAEKPVDLAPSPTPEKKPDNAEDMTGTQGTSVAETPEDGLHENQDEGSQGWLKALLWVGLAVGAPALALMLVVILRRRRHTKKEEDLLL